MNEWINKLINELMNEGRTGRAEAENATPRSHRLSTITCLHKPCSVPDMIVKKRYCRRQPKQRHL